ncbi:MAG TPA: family 10 glycosylhydrolase [Longimicrobiaceae bacterium]|nr:family 10 glycosylhydrolase [Longimicrobiaceae bacterium]
MTAARLFGAVLAAALQAAGCAGAPAPPPVLAPVRAIAPAPPVPREFRGVWVASVTNIDWPSRPGLPPDSQRAELVRILDRAAALHLNAVILQVRPAADALYPSPYEPWSEYLTGVQGQAPEPYYDPLAFAVAEAHRRGLELHAWFNPFRARHPSARSPLAPNHVARTHPGWVRRYGGLLWLDPGLRAVRDYSLRVILDVVRRYDIDGVHIDDYFYPYPELDDRGGVIPFPDSATYARYRRKGGDLALDDWRRRNVDHFVHRLYREVHEAKPWVKVGVSPFGIWRPGHPESVRGFDSYAKIYGDSRKWLREGWVDYFTPQLYWRIADARQSYPILLRWWTEQNVKGRHIWPGNYTSGVMGPWPASEILGQIFVTRGENGATGNVHFSMKALLEDPDSLDEKLLSDAYAEPALIPASPWLGADKPGRPVLALRARTADSLAVSMRPVGREPVWWWAVRARVAGAWSVQVLPGDYGLARVPAAADVVEISGVSRTGVEGPVAELLPGG